MSNTDLLEHDHDVLGSQIRHVTALLNELLAETFAGAMLRSEFLRETKLLHDQVVAHFHHEERAAFPQLAQLVPEYADMLRELVSAHHSISVSLNELQDLVDASTPETFDAELGKIVEAYERFHVAFLVHVQDESDALRKLGERLTTEQRSMIRAELEGD